MQPLDIFHSPAWLDMKQRTNGSVITSLNLQHPFRDQRFTPIWDHNLWVLDTIGMVWFDILFSLLWGCHVKSSFIFVVFHLGLIPTHQKDCSMRIPNSGTVINHQNISGWWLTYPSEKYESRLGWLFPIYGKMKNVPNHQPDIKQYHLRILHYVTFWAPQSAPLLSSVRIQDSHLFPSFLQWSFFSQTRQRIWINCTNSWSWHEAGHLRYLRMWNNYPYFCHHFGDFIPPVRLLQRNSRNTPTVAASWASLLQHAKCCVVAVGAPDTCRDGWAFFFFGETWP